MVFSWLYLGLFVGCCYGVMILYFGDPMPTKALANVSATPFATLLFIPALTSFSWRRFAYRWRARA